MPLEKQLSSLKVTAMESNIENIISHFDFELQHTFLQIIYLTITNWDPHKQEVDEPCFCI
jgi:hypothetical protein